MEARHRAARATTDPRGIILPVPSRIAAVLVALLVAAAIAVAAVAAVLVVRLPSLPGPGDERYRAEVTVHVIERDNREQRRQYATAAGLLVVALLGGAVAVALTARRPAAI